MNSTLTSTVMAIFNQLTGQYSGSIAGIQSGSIAIGKELFNAIALLSVGLLGINRLLNKNVDMVASNIELIRWLIYLNVFYLFLTEYDQFLPLIINSFQQAGTYLGGQAGGTYIVPTPAGIIGNGFDIALQITHIAFKRTLFLNISMALISVSVIVVILYCFGRIAIELLLIQIGSQIILAGGIFLLAFSGLQWTRDYAERYVHTFFHMGIKMLFMYVLIGIGAGLTNTWANSLNNISDNLIFQYFFAMVMATYVFYMLCLKLPEQATVYFTGRFPMAFEAVPSLPDVVKDVNSLRKKAVEWGTGKVSGMQGDAKARSAASQVARMNLEAQGKTPTAQDIQKEAIKTLGAAKKIEWEKKVDDTPGGKLAKDILDTIPKPKKTPKSKTKKDPDEDIIGNS
jgi:type IV secretion system protein TrbL